MGHPSWHPQQGPNLSVLDLPQQGWCTFGSIPGQWKGCEGRPLGRQGCCPTSGGGTVDAESLCSASTLEQLRAGFSYCHYSHCSCPVTQRNCTPATLVLRGELQAEGDIQLKYLLRSCVAGC